MHTRSLVILTILANASLVSAGPDETAAAAARRGHAAWKAGRIHEACEAFAASEQLEARVETERSLAACYEQDGKPASAARLYRTLAEHDHAKREASLVKAARLEARAPRLHVTIDPMPPGVVVTLDGVAMSSGEDALVDTGPHELVATAPGYEGHASAPVDRERTVVNVTIHLERRAEPAPEPAPVPARAPVPVLAPSEAVRAASDAAAAPAAAPLAADHRRRNGLVVGAAGLGVLVGAAVVFEAGSSKLDDAERLCPGSICGSNADLAKGKSLLSDGHTLRGVSIGMGIGGAALLAAGAYLIFTPHHEETRVSLHVDRGSAGVTYTAPF